MNCERCEKKHNGRYGSGRFCSSECAHGFSTSHDRESISNKVSIALGGSGAKHYPKLCEHCGKQRKRNADRFCSPKCHNKYKQLMLDEEIERTGIFHCYIRTSKDYLIRKRGHRCEICNLEVWRGLPAPLVFDHINGNSDDWRVENCRLVCRNCDGQLPTFTGRNKGNGASRGRKMARYREKRIREQA